MPPIQTLTMNKLGIWTTTFCWNLTEGKKIMKISVNILIVSIITKRKLCSWIVFWLMNKVLECSSVCLRFLWVSFNTLAILLALKKLQFSVYRWNNAWWHLHGPSTFTCFWWLFSIFWMATTHEKCWLTFSHCFHRIMFKVLWIEKCSTLLFMMAKQFEIKANVKQQPIEQV